MRGVPVRRFILFASLAGILFLTAFVGLPARGSQSDPSDVFAQTGHTVREPFLTFFNKHGGVARFGYPTTDDFVDPQTGLLAQYFEKARLEWHPGNPDPYKVQLGLLGDELGKRTPPIPINQIPARNDPSCLHFYETGHNLCHSFRTYWLENGGLDMFGYPIAEYTSENGFTIQYFQRARMEWHSEKPAGQKMQLALLGDEYYRYARLPEWRRLPGDQFTAGLNEIPTVTLLRARSSVLNGVVGQHGDQTGFVYVSDQLGNPIGGAAVTLVIHYPKGDESLALPPTNAKGTSFRTFAVGQAQPGQTVSIEFIIGYGGLRIDTRTSYLVWFD